MKAKFVWITVVMFGILLLASCNSRLQVGALQSETGAVELGAEKKVFVNVSFGAGTLDLSGGAQDLVETDFTYNVAQLKPVVKYTDGRLTIRQPESGGMPSLQSITDFRNEWDLRFAEDVPMDLTVAVGGGTSNLKVSDLSLTRLNINQGAGKSTIDLNGNWEDDLTANIDAGATDLTLMLPENIGVRIEVDRGPTIIDALGLEKNENVYTNVAYGESDVTLHIKLETGIGFVHMEVVEASALNENASNK